ncbi:MAG: hypothetical protein A3B10_01340 [Candidatus Doudnabacteria bacterium RIFCSPLOWO2_01_FULL_44_21]|uniref:Glycosyltransferase RgtA/B/C/D-like domain-containing protein n=1 Tax=Candidatus Doudnabacteria bacterium RIFCSPLOWO2_01_FULL_44_21 TaxID=1817841 RepID=A0A1F5PWY7_9BACT|nr:MAG: hypothetical protein A3B95_04250 [Candidatus Doudnabacteria bacterium RIFCSPHIGHO2_02_FULL_43_13b]OGE94426.1 MAG: hypothetical protein A3B10_01340 [Candidatus Doudnabacteria bacterium RIFCSPLOWO2_01_FULL_44_21]
MSPFLKKTYSAPISTKFWLVLSMLIGTILRFYNNTAVALWHDEAFSALYLGYPWGEMMHRIGLDVHPPLYYWVLRFWSYIFGSGLLSIRSLSILIGIMTIYAGYLFVKQAFKNDRLAMVAALLIAINPFQIQYSLEARMYTLGTFLVLLSSYLLLKALETNQTRIWVYYAISVAASLYTHYFLFFSIAAQGLYFLYYLWKEKNWMVKGWGSYLLSLILYLPWVPALLVQIKRVESAYWIPAPDRWSIPGTIWKMVFGGAGINHPTLVIATIVSLILIYYFFKETKLPIRWLIIFSLFLPFAASLALSFKQAIYLDRYFVFASLFFLILIACAIYLIPRRTTRRGLIIIFVAINVFVFFKNWQDLGVKNLFFNRSINYKPGMVAAAAFINDSANPKDKIYVGSSFVYFTFKYYNQTQIKPLLYSSGTLETIPHFSGTALLNNDDLILDFYQVQKDNNVWLLWTTGFGGSKPNVPGNWHKVMEKEFPDTPGFKGDIIVTQYHIG